MDSTKTICTVCDYVYDSTTNKSSFDALPDDWNCPGCGKSKEFFQPCTCIGIDEHRATVQSKTICTACNYVYDSSVNAPFDCLPDTWRCPGCGQSKDFFQPCSCVSLQPSTSSISADATVGELVAQHPPRANVFVSFGIDYCCGGNRKVRDVAAEKSIPLVELLTRLAAVDSVRSDCTSDWNTAPLQDLVKHIITVYHEPLRAQLNTVLQLAQKVARVHGAKHPEMVTVASVFRAFKDQLELHMQKEELILFPAIQKLAAGTATAFGCGGGIDHPIAVMTAEHDDAGEALHRLRELTNNYSPPADGCNSFRVLLYSLAEIESAMHDHVHKENNILFPRALKLATASASR